MSWDILLKLGLNALTGNWLGAAFSLIQGINLDLIFGLSNYGVLPVYIPNLSYDLSISDVPVGHGYSNVNLTINPGETKEITVLQNFQKSSLAPAVESIVSAGGIIDLHVSGTAFFNLLGITIPIPFESSKQISIKEEIQKRLNDEIQKNQQQSNNSLGNALKQSLDNTFESIKNTVNGVVNALNQFSGQKTYPSLKYETSTSVKLNTFHYSKETLYIYQNGDNQCSTITVVANTPNGYQSIPNGKIVLQMEGYELKSNGMLGHILTSRDDTLTLNSNGQTVDCWSARALSERTSYFTSYYFLGDDKYKPSHARSGYTVIKNHPPNIVKEGDFVTLSGPSIDPNTDTIKWRQMSGEHVNLSTTTNEELTFIAPDVEKGKTKTISFQFTVTDRFGVSYSDTIEVTVLSRD